VAVRDAAWQGTLRSGPAAARSGGTAQVIERFIECGDPHHGFVRIYWAPADTITCSRTRQDPLLLPLANFNPHLHVLATQRGGSSGRHAFIPLPAVPERLFAEGFRRAVLSTSRRSRRSRRNCAAACSGGATAVSRCTNQVRVGEQDAEGRRKLAGYMVRAPMALEKMRYDANTSTVIYRSKMHLELKRNFQVMPGAKVAGAAVPPHS
jgi:hypothetical protein